MICQNCGERPATVHVTKIINNEKKEMHLCEQCAREEGELSFDPSFSVQSLLAGLLGFGGGAHPAASSWSATQRQPSCQACGTSYADFAHSGRLGCTNCYMAFRENLVPLLRRVHGSVHHTGKVPRRVGRHVHVRRELAELQNQLQEFVDREEYEKAAQIRDKIRELKRALPGGVNGEH